MRRGAGSVIIQKVQYWRDNFTARNPGAPDSVAARVQNELRAEPRARFRAGFCPPHAILRQTVIVAGPAFGARLQPLAGTIRQTGARFVVRENL
jgi:hypothetical protein